MNSIRLIRTKLYILKFKILFTAVISILLLSWAISKTELNYEKATNIKPHWPIVRNVTFLGKKNEGCLIPKMLFVQ